MLSVVSDLGIFGYRVRGLDAGVPPSAVQQLDLHARSERLDHRVVKAVPDRAHRWQKPRSDRSLGGRPGGGLGAVVAAG